MERGLGALDLMSHYVPAVSCHSNRIAPQGEVTGSPLIACRSLDRLVFYVTKD